VFEGFLECRNIRQDGGGGDAVVNCIRPYFASTVSRTIMLWYAEVLVFQNSALFPCDQKTADVVNAFEEKQYDFFSVLTRLDRRISRS